MNPMLMQLLAADRHRELRCEAARRRPESAAPQAGQRDGVGGRAGRPTRGAHGYPGATSLVAAAPRPGRSIR